MLELGKSDYIIRSATTVVERKYFTCPSRESNPDCWIYRQTLYHVAVKAGFYRKAVEVCYIPIPTTYFPALNRFVPESHRNHAVIPGHSILMPETQAVDPPHWPPLST